MKVRSVKANNRRKAFEVVTAKRRLAFPFSRVEVQPTPDDPVANVFVDRELGAEGFTYVLQSGRGGTVHIEDVLEYNQDPDYLRNLIDSSTRRTIGSPSTSCSDCSRSSIAMLSSSSERRAHSRIASTTLVAASHLAEEG